MVDAVVILFGISLVVVGAVVASTRVVVALLARAEAALESDRGLAEAAATDGAVAIREYLGGFLIVAGALIFAAGVF